MPHYNKKRTDLMPYADFKARLDTMYNLRDKAFLSVLFFSGCRVSEAIALTPGDINCLKDAIYVKFFRLKGSQQTDLIPMPRTDELLYLCNLKNDPFSFCRTTGYRIVKRAFPELYPHYFRQNRFTTIAEKFPLATVINFSGLTPNAVRFYIAKVDIRKVGKALQEEIQ